MSSITCAWPPHETSSGPNAGAAQARSEFGLTFQEGLNPCVHASQFFCAWVRKLLQSVAHHLDVLSLHDAFQYDVAVVIQLAVFVLTSVACIGLLLALRKRWGDTFLTEVKAATREPPRRVPGVSHRDLAATTTRT